jgi:hypothetical protein
LAVQAQQHGSDYGRLTIDGSLVDSHSYSGDLSIPKPILCSITFDIFNLNSSSSSVKHPRRPGDFIKLGFVISQFNHDSFSGFHVKNGSCQMHLLTEQFLAVVIGVF